MQKNGKPLQNDAKAHFTSGKVDKWDVTALYAALAGCNTSPLPMVNEFDRDSGAPNYDYAALRDAVPCGLMDGQLVTKLKDDTRNAVAHCSEIKTFPVEKLGAMVEVTRTFAKVLFPTNFAAWSDQLDAILARAPGTSNEQVQEQQRRIAAARVADDMAAVHTLLQPGPIARLHSENIMRQKRAERIGGTREWHVLSCLVRLVHLGLSRGCHPSFFSSLQLGRLCLALTGVGGLFGVVVASPVHLTYLPHRACILGCGCMYANG